MAAPTADQLIIKVGGPQLSRGVFWRRPTYDKKERAAPIISRADASPCATYLGRDDSMRLAPANKLRVEWLDLDADGIRETPTILYEGTARTNLIENGDYETDDVGTGVNVATKLRDQTNVRRGAWAEKVTTTNSDNSGCFWNTRAGGRIPVTVGQPYTHSHWVYAPPASVGKTFRIILEWYTAVPAANGTSVSGNIVLVAGWQRVSWTGTPPASTATCVPTFYTNGAQGIFDVWVDVAQFEAGTFASSAIPTGTVQVTRQPDSVIIPSSYGPSALTILARFLEHGAAASNSGAGPATIGSGALSYARWDSFGTNYRWSHQTPGAAFASIPAGIPARGQLVTHVGQIYPDGSVDAFQSIAGGATTQGGRTAAIPFASVWSANSIALGAGGWHGNLLDLIVANDVFTKAEMETWLN